MTGSAGTFVDLRGLSPSERLATQHRAIELVGEGRIVIAPGDTGPIALMDGTERAWRESGLIQASADDAGAVAWLAPSTDRVGEVIPDNRTLARLMRRLSPGPAIYRVGVDEQGLMAARSELALPPGVIDHSAAGNLAIRLLGDALAGTLVRACPGTVLGYEPLASRAGTERELSRRLAMLGVEPALVLGDGPEPVAARRGPSVIAVDRRGGVRVEREGAYEARYIHKQMAMTILFVCTGNTCRSPMAEAIASGLLEKAGAANVRVRSAGTGAIRGAPPTPEGVRAMRTLGYAPSGGSSQPLTRQLIAEADAIFTMTRSHLQGVLALDKDAGEKTQMLDPDGEDVPDPIGLGQDAYDSTARRLEALIRQRLKEFGP